MENELRTSNESFKKKMQDVHNPKFKKKFAVLFRKSSKPKID